MYNHHRHYCVSKLGNRGDRSPNFKTRCHQISGKCTQFTINFRNFRGVIQPNAVCSSRSSFVHCYFLLSTWPANVLSELPSASKSIVIIKQDHLSVSQSINQIPTRGPIPRLGVTPGGRKLYH